MWQLLKRLFKLKWWTFRPTITFYVKHKMLNRPRKKGEFEQMKNLMAGWLPFLVSFQFKYSNLHFTPHRPIIISIPGTNDKNSSKYANVKWGLCIMMKFLTRHPLDSIIIVMKAIGKMIFCVNFYFLPIEGKNFVQHCSLVLVMWWSNTLDGNLVSPLWPNDNAIVSCTRLTQLLSWWIMDLEC